MQYPIYLLNFCHSKTLEHVFPRRVYCIRCGYSAISGWGQCQSPCAFLITCTHSFSHKMRCWWLPRIAHATFLTQAYQWSTHSWFDIISDFKAASENISSAGICCMEFWVRGSYFRKHRQRGPLTRHLKSQLSQLVAHLSIYSIALVAYHKVGHGRIRLRNVQYFPWFMKFILKLYLRT